MSDQCKHCQIRGDIEKCLTTECFHHENWWVAEFEKHIREDEHTKMMSATGLYLKEQAIREDERRRCVERMREKFKDTEIYVWPEVPEEKHITVQQAIDAIMGGDDK